MIDHLGRPFQEKTYVPVSVFYWTTQPVTTLINCDVSKKSTAHLPQDLADQLKPFIKNGRLTITGHADLDSVKNTIRSPVMIAKGAGAEGIIIGNDQTFMDVGSNVVPYSLLPWALKKIGAFFRDVTTTDSTPNGLSGHMAHEAVFWNFVKTGS
jgi:hypothetical protein